MMRGGVTRNERGDMMNNKTEKRRGNREER